MSVTPEDVGRGLNAIGGMWGVDLRMDVEDVLSACEPAITARARANTLRAVAEHLRNAHEDDEAARCILEWAENERTHNEQVSQ